MRLRSTLLALAAALAPAAVANAAPAEIKNPGPKVEVVFCLDTTGSMGGLIEGAKQKIWAICNQIVGGKPTPDLKVGLVAYRDRGDAYVTKVFDLTDDLDAIHGHLREFKAQGGGDNPESVNQALHESVTKINWSKDKTTLRIIFLVGDAPPHMDYADDVKYPESCKLARDRGILINAVQCGRSAECQKFWQDISGQGGGSYVQIAQNGGVVAVATPFDKRLGELNAEISKTNVCYGEEPARRQAVMKKLDAAKLPAASGGADRGGFAAKARRIAANDLLDDINEGKVKLKDVKEEQLPEELKKIEPGKRQAYLDGLKAKREAFKKEAIELDKKRADFIAKKLAEGKGKDGFDNQVLDILRKQAKKHNIEY